MHRITRILQFAVFFVLYTLSFSALSGQNLTTQQVAAWEEDIDFVLTKLWDTYPDVEQRLDKATFQTAADQLKSDLLSLSHDDAIIRLQALLALTGEGSNGIYPFQEKLNYDMLPMKAYWFEDGLFVCDAASPYEHLIGEQIVSVNNVPIEEVWNKLKLLLSGDNEYQKRGAATYTWQMLPWLAYLTETEVSTDATLTLGSGEQERVAFRPNSEYLALDRRLPSYRALPLSISPHAKDNYWMEYLPESRTLFIQFLAIRDNADGPSFKNFVQEIEDMLDGGTVDKVIVDNRYGGGGNGFKLKPFTDLLRDSERINQPGNLFILTGRGTRGTVQEMTSVLELNTKAILIGQPTGEGPNSVGDIKSVTLPNAGIDVWLVHTFWPTSWLQDPRMTIQPTVEVDYTWSSFEAQEDPWLQTALSYTAQASPSAEVSWEPKTGKYSNGKYTVTIEEEKGRYFLRMKRKLKSFFEISTELSPTTGDRYRADLADVYLEAGNSGDESLQLVWKGVPIPLNR